MLKYIVRIRLFYLMSKCVSFDQNYQHLLCPICIEYKIWAPILLGPQDIAPIVLVEIVNLIIQIIR
jgi:hypothetical protein